MRLGLKLALERQAEESRSLSETERMRREEQKAREAAEVSLDGYVRRAEFNDIQLSPTGEYLAMTVDRGEQDLLTVLRT